MRSRFTVPVAFAALALTTALALSAAPAAAADSYDWTGPYLGVNAGYSFGKASSGAQGTGTTATGGYWAAGDEMAVGNSARQDLNPRGFNGGIEAGYKHQIGNVVPGIDIGFGAFHTQDSFYVNDPYPSNAAIRYRVYSSIETNWLFTLRPKIGYAFGRFLVEAGVGLALTQLTVQQNLSEDNGRVERASDTDTRAGWVAGAALSYALTDSWSVKGEYLYTDFGRVDATGNLFNAGVQSSSQVHQSYDLQSQMLRVGVAYRF